MGIVGGQRRAASHLPRRTLLRFWIVSRVVGKEAIGKASIPVRLESVSDSDHRHADVGIFAELGERFQKHVAAPQRPFVVLFEQESPDHERGQSISE